MSRVGIVSDLHEPVSRKGALEFVTDIFEMWDVNEIVFIGDIIDWHGISFHPMEPQCPGVADEYALAKKRIAKWVKAFPKAKVCIGNHDERPTRLAKTVKIPEFMIKPYNELWDAPGWDWQYKHKIDRVLYRHGTGCGGIHPAWNLMNRIHQSVVIGHLHARAGIKYSMNSDARLFGMDVGCGIDEKAWQFAYSRDVADRPATSVGVVIDGVPYLEPMLIGKGETYHDSNF